MRLEKHTDSHRYVSSQLTSHRGHQTSFNVCLFKNITILNFPPSGSVYEIPRADTTPMSQLMEPS